MSEFTYNVNKTDGFSYVHIEVFDELGKSVGVILDDQPQKAGTYDVPLDNLGLTPGLYFIRILISDQEVSHYPLEVTRVKA